MFLRKQNHRSPKGMALLTGFIAAATLSTPNTASAWEFDTCSSTMTSEIDLSTPQAMIMLDRSGSMTTTIETHTAAPREGWWTSGGDWWTNNSRTDFGADTAARWADPYSNPVTNNNTIIVDFTNELSAEPSWGYGNDWGASGWLFTRATWFGLPGSLWNISLRELQSTLASYDSPSGPQIKFGLGTFSTNYNFNVGAPATNWARIWSEAFEYTNASDLMAFFDHPQQGGPIGSTPTASAIRAMALSPTVSNENTSNAGILITDGAPTHADSGSAYSNAFDDALTAACEHRGVAPMYVIGFSSGADVTFNNMLAAAGGTGSCTDEGSGAAADPCSMEPDDARDDLICTGAYQADNGGEFKDALDSITNQIACTYPLDILNTPDGKAPADPAGTRVFLGACTPGPGTHKAKGSNFDSSRSTGSPRSTSSAQLGLSCTDSCGAVNSLGGQLTYDLPTTAGEENIVRVRLADYLHNCQDTIDIEVRADGAVIGTWSGSGVNNWAVAEFPFTPSTDQTWITVVQKNDAYCNNNCSATCNPLANDLNLYVDWVKVLDPKAGCESNGRVSYVAPGSSGSGWTYNEDRTQVKLVGNACTQVKNRQHEEVVTQVACPCEQIPGGACATTDSASCPVGLWECSNEWEDICVPDSFCEDDGVCAPLTQHDTRVGQPNVQMVVDNSGSMGGWKHSTAKDVLGDLADWSHQGYGCNADGTNCDKLRLGLHFWSSGKNTEISAEEDTRKSQITSSFNNNPPSGGTYFHKAIELLRDENELNDANSPNIGIMVTDGAPSNRSTLKNSLKLACQIRKRSPAPIATYVLGFGSGNAENVNSLVAAAGGTGQCCSGNGCSMTDPTAAIDPCDYADNDTVISNLAEAVRRGNNFNGQRVYCDGNIPAADGDALKARLLELFENLQCTFPLTLLPDTESASANPQGTRVGIYLPAANDVVSVPHIDNSAAQADFVAQLGAKGVPNASDFGDQGWKFSNAGRTSIDLSQKICDEIQDQTITRVDTQVCEACEMTGDPCEVPCVEGDDNCDVENGVLYGRCRMGEYICVDGFDVCAQTRSPLPEICNGRDDSCDGFTDNLSDNPTDWSDPKWDLAAQGSDGQYAALACHNEDLCGCEGGQKDGIYGTGADGAAEFTKHLEGQYSDQTAGTAHCYCGAGLEPSFSAPSATGPASSPSAPHTEDSACSVSGTSDSSPLDAWWFFGVFGLFGVTRAKRRYLN